jgi:hypothetical protein
VAPAWKIKFLDGTVEIKCVKLVLPKIVLVDPLAPVNVTLDPALVKVPLLLQSPERRI